MSQVKLQKRADGVKTSYRDKDGNWREFETYALLDVTANGRRLGTLSTDLKPVTNRMAGLESAEYSKPVWRIVGMDWMEYDNPEEAVREVIRLHGMLGHIETRHELADAESTSSLLRTIDELGQRT